MKNVMKIFPIGGRLHLQWREHLAISYQESQSLHLQTNNQ